MRAKIEERCVCVWAVVHAIASSGLILRWVPFPSSVEVLSFPVWNNHAHSYRIDQSVSSGIPNHSHRHTSATQREITRRR